MAKKKINQMPKVKEQVTGSYVQNLVGNKPVTPVAQVQANAVNPTAVGGNSYQSYVNGGAAVAPGTTVNALRGQYAANLGVQPTATGAVVQKKSTAPAASYSNVLRDNTGGGSPTIDEVGGSGEGSGGEGNGKVVVEQYGPWLTEQKAREESIVEQYDEAKKYAEETKEGAYKSAEDNYNIAVRDANANFRTNQPTYGLQAEQLLDTGLSGGGHSDYLVGKAYEARTDEINAARSQRSSAEQLADDNYRQMMYQAGKDKRDAKNVLSDWRMNYQVQLDAEYKAEVEKVMQGILDGTYSAAGAETMLKSYAPGGVVSQDILDALKAQEERYWWYNNSSVTGDYLSFMQAQIAEGNIVNKETMRQWLKSSTNLDDATIEFWVNSFTDENGNVDKGKVDDAVNNQPQSNNNTGNTGNAGNTSNSGSTGTSTEDSKNRWSGDEAITRGNARFKNDALGGRTDLSDGDNFNINVNGKTYRVESGGELKDKTVLAALKDAGIEDGEVFSYGDQAFLKKNGKYYEIDTRVFRPNAEGNLVSSIGENTAAASNAENVGKHSYTKLAKASIWNSNAEPKVGKVLALETLDGKMRVRISSELGSDTAAYKAAVNDGIKDGQAFIHGEDVYVKKGNKVYMIAEDKKDYDSLKTYLNYNQNSLGSSAVKAVLNEVRDENGNPISDKANVNINGISFKMTGVGKYHENDILYKIFTDLGVKDGEMVLYNDKPYIYYNNSKQKMIGEYKYDGNIEELKKAFDPDVVAMPGVTAKSNAYDTVEGWPATTIEYLDKRATMLLGETEGIDSQVYRKAETDGVRDNEIFVFGGNVYQYIKGVGCTMLTPYKDDHQIWEEIKKEINKSGKNN